MSLATVLAASIAVPAVAQSTITTSQVGPFSITTKIDDRSQAPIMHTSLVSKEVRLEWRSADNRAVFGLNDSGAQVTTSYGLVRPDGKGLICGTLGGGKLLRYPTASRATKHWRSLRNDWIAGLAATCKGAVNAKQIASYREEFTAAADDFVPAIEAMKSAAQKQFGGWRRRCLKFKIHRNVMPNPYLECVRYSAKVS